MPIAELDHYFVWARDLERSCRFYCEVLGLEKMPRPAVQLPGYWLGVNGKAQVHMGLDSRQEETVDDVSATAPSADNNTSVVDHIGFLATEPESFVKRLRRLGVPTQERYIESMKLLQVHLSDPDGLSVELNFPDIEVEPSWLKESTN